MILGDVLYQNLIQELNVLYDLLEQDKNCLSGCLKGEVLESYSKNTELLIEQLDSIKKELSEIMN